MSAKPTAPVKANFDAPFEVRIVDAKGAPVKGAEVEVVLTMVDMDHGEFKTAFKESKAGVYEGKPKFIMVGDWNVEVRAKKGTQTAVSKQQMAVEH